MTARRMTTAKMSTFTTRAETVMISTQHGPHLTSTEVWTSSRLKTSRAPSTKPATGEVPVEVNITSSVVSTHTSPSMTTLQASSTLLILSTQNTEIGSTPRKILSTTQIFSTRIMPSTMESSTRSRFTSTRIVQTTPAFTTTFIPLNSMPMMTNFLRFTTQDFDPWGNHRERFRRPAMTTRGKPRNKHYKI